MATGQNSTGAGEGVNNHKKGDHMAEESHVDVEKSNGVVTYEHPLEWGPTWFEVGPVKFAAFGDRLLVEEDEFRSGYECKACGGTGKRECTQCDGAGFYMRGANAEYPGGRKFKCSQCDQGKVTCIECGGRGGLIVVPEVSQRRPSTGKVVSIGDKVSNNFHVGDNVLYSNFAGHTVDLERAGFKVVLRILHETEILAQVKGHLELRQLRNEKEALGI